MKFRDVIVIVSVCCICFFPHIKSFLGIVAFPNNLVVRISREGIKKEGIRKAGVFFFIFTGKQSKKRLIELNEEKGERDVCKNRFLAMAFG